MSKNITFTNMFEGCDFFPPKPAVKEVPDWYINTPEYVGNEGKKITNIGHTPHTIKKCMPVFDAITSGYILYTQVDVQVLQKEGLPSYSWPDQDPISFHPIIQAPLHPARNEAAFPKWNNFYAISTPPGYSVLITQPMHRESVFTILDGIVDTDQYKARINFPFVLNDIKWEGIIPAGTPMAQVIPFKRESWKYKIGSDKERTEQLRIARKLRTLFFNSYKRQFWSSKEYR
jgi:hypothetical protein